MATIPLTLPITKEQVRSLRIGDQVILQGPLFGIRDATQIALFDRGRRTRFDLSGHAVIHTAPNLKRVPVDAENPAGYAKVCIGTTTSARMERFTRLLLETLGVRLIIGKGGLLADSKAAFRDFGGAYLAITGGAAALETRWIETIEDVDLDDLNPESLWRFRVRDFGPLLVAMDSTGASLYDAVQPDRAAALAALGLTA
jgi:L(+)-tartrate dehydratase beta subunit